MRWRGLLCAVAVALAPVGCSRPPGASSSARPNVLLVTIDTFRADRLGAGVAPALDSLAQSSVVFTSARATVPLTLPSHVTIHTGLLPPAHAVRENGLDSLGEQHPTIATLLKRAGYRTAAFVGAFVLDRRFGLAQGFDVYDDQIPRDPNATERLEAERPASAVVDRALAWLEHPAPGTEHAAPGTEHPAPSTQHPAPTGNPAPFFLWIHLYDPHAPYNPPPEFRARTNSAYNGEIAYADAQIGRVFDSLRRSGLLARTLVIVAGDHGEGLGDHGERTHGMLLYDSTLRVPLIVAAPGGAATRRSDAVSLAAIAPTIVRAAGLAPPTEMTGPNLVAIDTVDDRQKRHADDLYAETEYPRVAGWTPLQALTDARWKTIRAGPATEVYDLQNDPAEARDVGASQPSVATAMTATIDRVHASGRGSANRPMPPEAAERLRALGYVSAAPSKSVSSSPTRPNPSAKIADWNAFEDALSALNDHRADAAAMLERLAAGNPDAQVFQTTYARALKDAGQPDRALAVYRGAAKRWPDDATLLHDIAVAARDAANLTRDPAKAAALRQEAQDADRAAVALAPESAIAHNGLGLMAIDANKPREAVSEFERAAAIDPGNASYWANLGNARRAISDPAGAEQAYRRALDVEPRTADAANGLGVLRVEAHQPADAVQWFERALAASPDFAEARLNLGIALQESGQTARAVEIYRSLLGAPSRHARERDAAAKLLASLGAAR